MADSKNTPEPPITFDEIFDLVPKIKQLLPLAEDLSQAESTHRRLLLEHGMVRSINLLWDQYSEEKWEKLNRDLSESELEKLNRKLPARLRWHRAKNYSNHTLVRTESSIEQLSTHTQSVGFSKLDSAVAGIGIVYRVIGNPVMRMTVGERFKLLPRNDDEPDEGLQQGTIFCANPNAVLEVLGRSEDEVSILMIVYGVVESNKSEEAT
jgi:hypothetical protein